MQGSATQDRYLLDLSKALSCNASCSLVPIDSEIGDDYQVLDLLSSRILQMSPGAWNTPGSDLTQDDAPGITTA